MKQLELNTPFNLSLNMNDTISRSYTNFHENSNSKENDLKLFDNKLKNRSRIIKQNSINPAQSNNSLKNNKSKFILF